MNQATGKGGKPQWMASAVEPASVHYEDVTVNSIAGAVGEKCHRDGPGESNGDARALNPREEPVTNAALPLGLNGSSIGKIRSLPARATLPVRLPLLSSGRFTGQAIRRVRLPARGEPRLAWSRVRLP
jgi:hypothetical protein